MQVRGDRDDARCHDHGEIGGMQRFKLVAPSMLETGAALWRTFAAAPAEYVLGCLGRARSLLHVNGGRQLRSSIRQREMGYVMAVRASHTVTTGSGRTVTAAAAARMIPQYAWHRMRTGSGTKGHPALRPGHARGSQRRHTLRAR